MTIGAKPPATITTAQAERAGWHLRLVSGNPIRWSARRGDVILSGSLDWVLACIATAGEEDFDDAA